MVSISAPFKTLSLHKYCLFCEVKQVRLPPFSCVIGFTSGKKVTEDEKLLCPLHSPAKLSEHPEDYSHNDRISAGLVDSCPHATR